MTTVSITVPDWVIYVFIGIGVVGIALDIYKLHLERKLRNCEVENEIHQACRGQNQSARHRPAD